MPMQVSLLPMGVIMFRMVMTAMPVRMAWAIVGVIVSSMFVTVSTPC